ncbi:MAG: monovalent cation/H(+) antiporter subunit G [Pseudomonadota bacterium]
MSHVLLNLWTILAVSAGVFFFLAGTLGLLRFPDTLTRLHALTKADNLGLGLVVLGLLPQMHSASAMLKLLLIWLLVLFSGAVVGQMLAEAVRRRELDS